MPSQPAPMHTPETELRELKALIEKSDLVEVPSCKVYTDGGHPVLRSTGTILRHRGYKAEVEQKTKDLQAHASTARKLAKSEERCAALLAALQGLIVAMDGEDLPALIDAEQAARAALSAAQSNEREGL